MTKLKPSRYNIIAKYKDTHLIVHNLLRERGFMLGIDNEDRLNAILNDPAGHCGDDLVSHLVEAGCLISQAVDEKLQITEKKSKFLKDQEDTLTLTIIPTYECNFKCIYCWEHTKDTKDGMSVEAQKRLLNYIDSELQSFSSLNIDWFGGEPLMAFHVIENLSKGIDAICKAHRIPYFCSLTTNGFLLTEERFRFLLQHHTRFFQVTVDGPEELHNRNRPLKSGRRAAAIALYNPEGVGVTSGEAKPRGTYERIVQNLRNIRDNVEGRFEFVIRLNVTKETRDYVDEFLDFYRKEFAPDWRFRLYIQAVEEHDGLRADIMGDKFLDRSDDVVERIFDACIQDGVRVSSLRVDSPGDLMCKARQKNSYFVNSDGRFYKCDMCMNDQHVTYSGDLSQNGTLLKIEKNLARWEAIQPPEYCDSCVLQPLCFGLKCPYYNTIQGKTQCELFNSYSVAENAVKAFAQAGKYNIVS